MSANRIGQLLLILLCLVTAPTWAKTPAADKPVAAQTPVDALRTVEADLSAAREKLTAGPSQPWERMLAEGIATQAERDEWTLLLNLRIASLEKHLDALRSLGFETHSRKETQAQADAWTGFTQPAPYSIDFIDDLWGDLIARQQDIDALQIARTLVSTQLDDLKRNLEKLQAAGRLAAEQAQQAGRRAAAEQARLIWLSELAGERTQTTLSTLAQYDAILRYNAETLAHQQLKVDFLRRRIDVATGRTGAEDARGSSDCACGPATTAGQCRGGQRRRPGPHRSCAGHAGSTQGTGRNRHAAPGGVAAVAGCRARFGAHLAGPL
ncbi:MAG: hypothetical protein HZB57_02380 [Gammaproteobacteria bacterium]|nr:hypothetical protein [Gammaproteobacteria bacterium]